jgi:hypothetical protein
MIRSAVPVFTLLILKKPGEGKALASETARLIFEGGKSPHTHHRNTAFAPSRMRHIAARRRVAFPRQRARRSIRKH